MKATKSLIRIILTFLLVNEGSQAQNVQITPLKEWKAELNPIVARTTGPQDQGNWIRNTTQTWTLNPTSTAGTDKEYYKTGPLAGQETGVTEQISVTFTPAVKTETGNVTADTGEFTFSRDFSWSWTSKSGSSTSGTQTVTGVCHISNSGKRHHRKSGVGGGVGGSVVGGGSGGKDGEESTIVCPDPFTPEMFDPFNNLDERIAHALSPATGVQLVAENIVSSATKYGFDTLILTNPPQRFLMMNGTTSLSGGNPESPVGGAFTDVISKDDGELIRIDQTGKPSYYGIPPVGGTRTATSYQGSFEVDGYDDCPNKENDTPATMTTTLHLDVEHTTAQVKADAIARSLAFMGDGYYENTSPLAMMDVSKDELNVTYQKTSYKVRIPTDETAYPRPYRVTWVEVFTPKDNDPNDTMVPEKEFKLFSEEIAAGSSETQIHTMTPNNEGTWEANLIPVEVKEVWSNQIADVEVNGFPDKTGRNNQPYSIMGVRDDGNAYIRIKLKSAIPAEFRQKILFRLRQPQVSKPGSSSFGPGGDVVDVIAESVSDNPEINHRVYFGYDSDGNGELSEAEALGTVSSTVNGQDKIPVEFKVISKTRHEQSRQKNIEFAGNGFAGIVPNMAPTGASLIKSFHKALPPDSNTTNATTIDRTGDNRLSHPVGVAFEPTEVPGDAVNGVYNRNHLLAENVLKSQPFRNACRDGFDTILPILISRRDTTGISEDFLTFTWEETVGDPSLNFRLNQNSLPNMPDFDSFLALGKVRVENARVGFRYDLNTQFVEVFFQGTFKDLYDFDYDDSFDLIVWSVDEIRQGAETQAGYPTLTKGGKVFTTQLDIRNGEEYIDSGYGFFLYK